MIVAGPLGGLEPKTAGVRPGGFFILSGAAPAGPAGVICDQLVCSARWEARTSGGITSRNTVSPTL